MIAIAGPTPIGVDLGRRQLRAVQLSHGRIVAATTITRKDPSLPIDANDIARLADVLYRQGFVGRRIVLAVPRDMQLSAVLQLPPRGADVPIQQIARMELARTHACEPSAFEMVSWDIPAPARAGKGTHMLAAACKHADSAPLLAACNAAGLDVVALDVASLALSRAARSWGDESDGLIALLNLDWSAGLLVLRQAQTVIYERDIDDIGLWHLHAQVQQQLNCDLQVGDFLLNAASAPADGATGIETSYITKTARIAERFMQMVSDEVRASLDFAAHQYPDHAVSKLLVTGQGASCKGLCKQLASATHVETRKVSPSDIVACPDDLLDRCGRAELTLAMGLADGEAA